MKLLKKITDKRILYIFSICILFFIPILKQSSFYLVKFRVISNHDSINLAYILYFCIPFFIYLYVKDLIKTKREFDIYDYIFYMLIIAGIMSSIFAIDSKIAWFGKSFRHEGFFTVLCYYLLFINWKIYGKKEDIKKIINIFIILGIINSIYGLLQIYTTSSLILRYTPDKSMASGLCGNPNFFGSLIVTVLSIVTTKFLIEKKFSIKSLILIILFFISLINAQSTGPFIAYIVVILFLVIYLFLKKKFIIPNLIYLFAVLLITYASIYFVNKEIFNIEKCEICDFTETIGEIVENKDSNANYYTISNGRVQIWKNSLKIVKENLINGVGYDNFYLGYYKGINLTEVRFVSIDGQIKAVRKYPEIVDNAHNVYLHTLISTGLLGLIPYLLLCLFTFIRGLSTKENLVIFLLSGFVAYSIQAFGNINVIQVTPIYYIIIGLILSIKQ